MRIKTLFILILTAFLLPMAVFAATVPVNWETYNLYGVTQSNMMIKTSGCTVGTNTTGIFDTAASLETNETSGTLTFSSGEVCTVEATYTKTSSSGGPYYLTVNRDTVDWYTNDNLGIRTRYCNVNASETDAQLSIYSSGFGNLAFDTISCNVDGVYNSTFTAASAQVAEPPSAPEVAAVAINGFNITVSWSTVSGATGYKLYYAANPYTEGDTIGSMDMQSATSYSIDLWSGASYYVAVTAYNAQGESELLANVQLFTVE